MLDKICAWLMTLSAVAQAITWIGGGSGAAAWFAFTAAWFAWMVVVRVNRA
jgi:hypothetical protein